MENVVEVSDKKKLSVNAQILIWELVGAFVIILLGALFHFMFELLNKWVYIAWFFPVNESVWEHIKIAFWPALLYFIAEYGFLRKKANNYFIAKALTLYLNALFTIMVFYTYTGAFGIENLIIDILIFVLAVIIQQILNYKIHTMEQFPKKQNLYLTIIAIIALVIFGVMIIVFTYLPPGIPLFKDSLSGEYGIV